MKAQIKVLENNVLCTKWNAEKLSISDVKEIMEEMLLYMMQYPIKKYVDDISECEVDWDAADKWIVKDWFERALKLGVTKNALIVKAGIEMSHDGDQCQIKSFNQLDEALSWIYT